MKKFLSPVIISVLVISVILTLPFMLPKRKLKKYSDEELRQTALSRNMLPNPKTYKELLKIIDNPENHMTKKKIKLGKKLFFDTILSRDKTINCASCHILSEGGDDNLPTAVGFKGRKNPSHLNSPTVLNAALAKAEFWNGRAKNVEEQAGGPIQAHFEMNMTPNYVVSRLKNDATYVQEFQKVFTNGITFENVKKAVGAYERTLLTRGSYDRFLEGDNNAISQEAKKGFALFINLGCKGCHTGRSVGGQSLQRFPLRRCSSIYDLKCWFSSDKFPFKNTGGFLGKNDMQLFRVPILRNVIRTSPYFHNGAIKDIKEAVKIMGKHQVGVELTKKQVDEIVAFLKTLNGKIVDYKLGD
ncbi:MAG: c-type cytochrome [Epsilonproteobacteria bacterium]|nr:c-type cytochrome [Campylobacterota bacterium]